MANGSVGMSGHNFDAFVSSQRSYNEPDWAAKIQEKYWRARQKFLAKIEKKEDSCIVLSDSKLDSKLEIYRSIDRSCARLTDILESYQNCLFMFANEENALGILLKECGKHDKTKAGKIMSLTGKSLTQSSHQRIRLYMPLLRLYQEMETFHSRAVNDTSETVDKLESKRARYRSSLLWMKDISEKLDPDVYRQLDKFRRVQNKVRDDKKAFDSMQMDVVQKIDLLMASRCNLINQTLAPYQAILLETFQKNHNNFKSVEEIIKSEDLYEYEFKTLKQLNPLKISDDASLTNNRETVSPEEQGCNDQDLLGGFENEEKDSDNNNEADHGCALIDVQASTSVDSMKEADTPKPDDQDELAKSLDLLNSLFGSSHDESNLESNQPPSNSKTKKREEELRALRSNLNTNLLDLEGLDGEKKQVASLLGLSEQTFNKEKPDGKEPFRFLQEDLFSKWAKVVDDSDGSKAPHDGNNNGSVERDEGANMPTVNDLDQDLMDIGAGSMPKASDKGLDDFLA